MDSIIAFDRQVTRWLGRGLRAVQDQTHLAVHPLAFWGTAVLYMALWVILCGFENQPQWVWYLVGAGMGTVAAYVADNEPAALLEERLALTHFGLDTRWALMRLIYTPVALFLIVPLLLEGEHSLAFVVVLLLEIVVFALLEYLLTFRLVDEDHPLMRLYRSMGMVAAETAGGSAPAGEGAAPGESGGDTEPAEEPS